MNLATIQRIWQRAPPRSRAAFQGFVGECGHKPRASVFAAGFVSVLCVQRLRAVLLVAWRRARQTHLTRRPGAG